jgi:hypothetical protein
VVKPELQARGKYFFLPPPLHPTTMHSSTAAR